MNYLLDQKLPCPISLIILPVLHNLSGFLQISNCRCNNSTSVQSSTRTFLVQLMLILKCSCLIMSIICLTWWLVMRTENQSLLDIICWPDVFLLIWRSHFVSDKVCTISQHGWQENFLLICNNIRAIMPIKIQALFVRNISKAFEIQPVTSCT